MDAIDTLNKNLEKNEATQKSIAQSLLILTAIKLANEFYDKKDREDLCMKYERMISINHEKLNNLHNAEDSDKTAMLEEKKKSDSDIRAFQKLHGVICDIVHAKAQCNKKY